MQLQYKNQRAVGRRDLVVGFDNHGQPLAGTVLDINEREGTIQVSPAIQHPTWIPAKDCLLADDALKIKEGDGKEQRDRPQHASGKAGQERQQQQLQSGGE